VGGLKLEASEIGELEILNSPLNSDVRGFLRVIYDRGINNPKVVNGDILFQRIIMVNSKRGTLRGIHKARKDVHEVKLLACVSGKIREIVVDLRPESPTFKRHTEIILEAKNNCVIIIPNGCGHAYEVLSKEATLIYGLNTSYSPEKELIINALDPELNIDWGDFKIRSSKDLLAKNLASLIEDNLI
jgi:dTDP-4-dehydrorhamnose 3,5-epimerase